MNNGTEEKGRRTQQGGAARGDDAGELQGFHLGANVSFVYGPRTANGPAIVCANSSLFPVRRVD